MKRKYFFLMHLQITFIHITEPHFNTQFSPSFVYYKGNCLMPLSNNRLSCFYSYSTNFTVISLPWLSGKENCALLSKFQSNKCMLYFISRNIRLNGTYLNVQRSIKKLFKIYFPCIWSVRQTLLHTVMGIRQFYALPAKKLLRFFNFLQFSLCLMLRSWQGFEIFYFLCKTILNIEDW